MLADGIWKVRAVDLQWVQNGEGGTGCQDGHDGNHEVDAAMGEDHDHVAALDAILHKMVC